MLEETATVVKADSRHLWVEVRSRSGCTQCSSGSCTTAVVSKLFGMKRNRLRLENSLGAKRGDRVVIGIPDELLVKASAWAYLYPLLVMFAATAAGSFLGADQGMQATVALIGLAAGFGMVHWHTARQAPQDRFRPVLLKVIETASLPIAVDGIISFTEVKEGMDKV
ncbi:MAG: SoxR reducing system RseC family protein [Sedimenticola sp.]